MSAKNSIGSLLHSLSTQWKEMFSSADPERDGKSSAVGAKAIAPATRDHVEPYQAAHPGDVSGDVRASSVSTRSHDVFLGSGPGTPVALAGVKATQLPVSAPTQALAKALTLHPDWPFFATGFQLEPAALKAVLADPAQQKAFLNAALFQATGTGYATQYPDYYSADRLEVTPSADAAAGASYLLGKLTELGAFGQGGADRTAVAGELAAITRGLFEAGAGRSFALTWTNHDDAQFHAVVSVNEATGQVRVTGFYPVP